MVNIENTKKTLQTMLDIMIYIKEVAPRYEISFSNLYSEKHPFVWDGPDPSNNQIDNAGLIIMNMIPGDFYTPLGSFRLFDQMNFTDGRQKKRFCNHIKDKFGVIEIGVLLHVFSKDIEGNPLPIPNSTNYQKHILKPAQYLSCEESKNIWDNVKSQLIAEMFIRHPGLLSPKRKPSFVLENKYLSTLWDHQSVKQKLKLMQTGLPDRSIDCLAKKLCPDNDTLLERAFRACYQSNSTFFRTKISPPSSPSTRQGEHSESNAMPRSRR